MRKYLLVISIQEVVRLGRSSVTLFFFLCTDSTKLPDDVAHPFCSKRVWAALCVKLFWYARGRRYIS